jgi:3-hydroxyisobutyrate dehydrogenase-like beta-hydroxyacid dehydrogenase
MKPMPPVRIGFVGFGEVAATLSERLAERGAQVFAYDVLLEQDGGRAILQKRRRAEGVEFLSLRETVPSVGYMFSTATTQAARQVAQECAPYLKRGQVYLDLNSTAPSVKVEMAKIIAPSGADFVEGAILGAVGTTGAKTHILTGGERSPSAAEALRGLGLNVTHYSLEIGKASMFKMLRSIFSKGLEALVLEFLIAGKRAGIERDLWNEVVELMSQHPFDQTSANWIETHAVAYERRYHEVVQVTETMREIGLEPVMTAGTLAFFKRSCGLGLGNRFTEKPDSMNEVIDFMEQHLSEGAE